MKGLNISGRHGYIRDRISEVEGELLQSVLEKE